VTVTVTAQAPPGATVTSSTDVARATSSTIGPNPSNNAATASVGVVRRADVAVTKTAEPGTVVAASATLEVIASADLATFKTGPADLVPGELGYLQDRRRQPRTLDRSRRLAPRFATSRHRGRAGQSARRHMRSRGHRSAGVPAR
jgi:hypothetical protein